MGRQHHLPLLALTPPPPWTTAQVDRGGGRRWMCGGGETSVNLHGGPAQLWGAGRREGPGEGGICGGPTCLLEAGGPQAPHPGRDRPGPAPTPPAARRLCRERDIRALPRGPGGPPSPPARPHKLGTPFSAGCERSDPGACVCLDTPSLWLPVLLRGARDYDGAWGSLAVGSGSGATGSPQAPALPLTHALATGPHRW